MIAVNMALAFVEAPSARDVQFEPYKSLFWPLLITEWCFTVHGCVRVELVAEVGNAGSRAVARRAGFIEEGVLRARMRHRDQRIDVVMCSRLPADPVGAVDA